MSTKRSAQGSRGIHLAVLISGQVARFAREHGGLNASALRLGSGDPPDVHVVLAQTTYSRLSSPLAALPGSARPVAKVEHQLLQWFRSQGFQHDGVTVKVFAQSEVDATMRRYDDLVANVEPALWSASAPLRRQVLHGNIVRWIHNGRMLWLRHAAFVAALQHEERSRPYSYFLCLREDNRFLAPGRPIPAEASEALTRRHRRGLVALDRHCGFIGAPSDKISFSDRKGAMALFGNSTAAHVGLLLSWLRFGLRRQQGSGPMPGGHHETPSRRVGTRVVSRGGGAGTSSASSSGALTRGVRNGVDALQSEAFLFAHLRAERVSVATWDFARTDVALRLELHASPSAVSAAGTLRRRGHDAGVAASSRPTVKRAQPNTQAEAHDRAGASHGHTGASTLRPCVRSLYYSCGPPMLREQRLVPMCEPTTPHDRQLFQKYAGG